MLVKRRVGDTRYWTPGGKAQEALELLEFIFRVWRNCYSLIIPYSHFVDSLQVQIRTLPGARIPRPHHPGAIPALQLVLEDGPGGLG